MAEARMNQEVFVYEGFGFPIVLLNVPMVQIRGEWTPDIDYNDLSGRLQGALARKPGRLTGSEVRFLRHSVSMTLEKFAERFGVTHPAVLKWERAGSRPTAMSWAVEKDIRLEVLRLAQVDPVLFMETYRALSRKPPKTSAELRLEFAQRWSTPPLGSGSGDFAGTCRSQDRGS